MIILALHVIENPKDFCLNEIFFDSHNKLIKILVRYPRQDSKHAPIARTAIHQEYRWEIVTDVTFGTSSHWLGTDTFPHTFLLSLLFFPMCCTILATSFWGKGPHLRRRLVAQPSMSEVYLNHKVNTKRSVHNPWYHLIITLIISLQMLLM